MFTIGKQYLHMIDNEVVFRIAQKIRMIRLERSLTIQEVARRAHVSKGLLSKIENSRTIPSLPVFITILQSLDISLMEFFREMVLLNGKNYLLIRRDQHLPMEREEKTGLNYRYILSQNTANGTMEAMLMTVDPGAKGNPSTSDGYEFTYVLSGSCEYQINNEVISLEEGDALYFDASMPHLPINQSRRKVDMLVICFKFPRH